MSILARGGNGFQNGVVKRGNLMIGKTAVRFLSVALVRLSVDNNEGVGTNGGAVIVTLDTTIR